MTFITEPLGRCKFDRSPHPFVGDGQDLGFTCINWQPFPDAQTEGEETRNALDNARVVCWFCPVDHGHRVEWATDSAGMQPHCIEPHCGIAGSLRTPSAPRCTYDGCALPDNPKYNHEHAATLAQLEEES